MRTSCCNLVCFSSAFWISVFSFPSQRLSRPPLISRPNFHPSFTDPPRRYTCAYTQTQYTVAQHAWDTLTHVAVAEQLVANCSHADFSLFTWSSGRFESAYSSPPRACAPVSSALLMLAKLWGGPVVSEESGHILSLCVTIIAFML